MATTLLDAWKAFSRANRNMQQFGQTDDESTWNGACGCTHICAQRLVKAKTGRYYSQDELSKIAGYPWPDKNPNKRGMYSPSEFQRIVDHFDLPYRYKSGVTWEQIIDALKLGPVVTGIRYGYWPEKVGAVYMGTKADGRPGGYAYYNGKTQLKGAESIYHAIVLFGRRYARKKKRWVVYANEPNHGSPSRPEKPDYDRVRSSYAHRAFNQYGSDGRTHFAWLPTKTFRPKGY